LLEKERMIDAEIKQEIEKYSSKHQKRVSGQASGPAPPLHAVGIYSEDVIEVVDGNAHGLYASSDGEGNEDGDSPRANHQDKEDR